MQKSEKRIIILQKNMEMYQRGRTEPHSKCGCREIGTWVRIPPSPPNKRGYMFNLKGVFGKKSKDKDLEKYIKKNLIRTKGKTNSHKAKTFVPENITNKIGLSFSQTLLDMIDKKGMTDVECYKSANIDRKLFSKIRCNNDYKPSKETVLALAIGLKLSKDETNELLLSAGYILSPSILSDIIVLYFIENKLYDINNVNIALYEHGQKVLGAQ